MRRLLCRLKYNFLEIQATKSEENLLIIYDRSLLRACKGACRVKESSSPSYVHFNPVYSQHVLVIALLNSYYKTDKQWRINGVWRFLHSIRYCGIGRPKRSFSFSINKGEPIFIWSVLYLQVIDRNLINTNWTPLRMYW